MLKKLLTSFILSFCTINIFAVNLIIVEGSYEHDSCTDKETLFAKARDNAYSKLVGDKEEYEQISKWQEKAYRWSKDCDFDAAQVSASFVKKAEDTGERFVQTKGKSSRLPIVDPYTTEDQAWESAQFTSLQNAKFYCNAGYDPEFLKIVSKKSWPWGYGYIFYEVTADYKC